MSIVASLTALLKLDTSGFSAGVGSAIKKAGQLNRKLTFVSRDIQGAGRNLTALSAPLALFGVSSVRAAARAEENANKIRVVFSNMEKDAGASIKKFADDFKLAESSAVKLMSTTGDLLTGFGFTQREALKLSDQVNRLAADLTSFNPGIDSVSDASERLTKGLLGQTKAMLALRIAIRQDSTEFQRQLKVIQQARGITLEQARALLILKVATEQSKNAIGDFARTQDSFINVIRRTIQRIIDLKVEVGKFLIEGLGMEKTLLKVIDGIKRFTKFIKGLSPNMKKFIANFLLAVVVAGPLLLVIGAIGLAITGIVSGFLALSSAVAAIFTPIGLAIVGLLGLGAALIKVFDVDLKKVALKTLGFLLNIRENFSIAANFITQLWSNVWNNLGTVVGTLAGNIYLNIVVMSEKIGAVLGALGGWMVMNWKKVMVDILTVIVKFIVQAIRKFAKFGTTLRKALRGALRLDRVDLPSLIDNFVSGLNNGILKGIRKQKLGDAINAALSGTSGFVPLTAGLENIIPEFGGFITSLSDSTKAMKDAAKTNKEGAEENELAARLQASSRSIAGLTRGSVEAFRVRSQADKAGKETAANTRVIAQNSQETVSLLRQSAGNELIIDIP